MADVDLLSYSEAQRVVREVGSASTTNGALLTAAITGVSLALEKKCGPIIQRTVTEYHDGGDTTFWVDQWPVTSITSVVEYDGATPTTLTQHTNGAVSAASFAAGRYSQPSAPYSGRISRVDGVFPDGQDNVVVTYVAGRFASNGAVTEDFKAAFRMSLENWWSQYRNGVRDRGGDYELPASSFPRFDIPNAALDLLGDEVHENRAGHPDVQVG